MSFSDVFTNFLRRTSEPIQKTTETKADPIELRNLKKKCSFPQRLTQHDLVGPDPLFYAELVSKPNTVLLKTNFVHPDKFLSQKLIREPQTFFDEKTRKQILDFGDIINSRNNIAQIDQVSIQKVQFFEIGDCWNGGWIEPIRDVKQGKLSAELQIALGENADEIVKQRLRLAK
ncbi:hypothetical protein SS50377_27055 [Spironucleus salmonicida]|uniref:Uncharacterized protein n=1 Tax=Spironucleus salmonicida TaxID=348837 RepID=V6LWF6_9EUKA|nr:hypothetical protein SS50377_27055 [Spironucleus salmonicida]|eukprot:EST48041.1 Hypothetical protein SS50377_11807 [Spironucleus salmonicida]